MFSSYTLKRDTRPMPTPLAPSSRPANYNYQSPIISNQPLAVSSLALAAALTSLHLFF